MHTSTFRGTRYGIWAGTLKGLHCMVKNEFLHLGGAFALGQTLRGHEVGLAVGG